MNYAHIGYPGTLLRKLSTEEMGRLAPGIIPRSIRHPVCLVAENIRSAFNVGAMLRTADALALEHVYLTGFTPHGSHRGVHKSALGAQDSVPWTHVDSPEDCVRSLRARGYTLAALEITDQPRTAADLRHRHFPLALVVGNEVDGISPETLALCDLAVELPQYGVKHSLNVSVATGVMGYDLVRRWHELTRLPHEHTP